MLLAFSIALNYLWRFMSRHQYFTELKLPMRYISFYLFKLSDILRHFHGTYELSEYRLHAMHSFPVYMAQHLTISKTHREMAD